MKFAVVDGKLKTIGDFAKTRKAATRNSLKGWKTVVDALVDGEDHVFTGGIRTCNLCQLYYDDGDTVDSECYGCPIRGVTGQGECRGTPFYAYRDTDDHGQSLRAARRMVRLLEKLAND